MRLIALQDVPDSVVTIPKGSTFVCVDEDRAKWLVRGQYAKVESPPDEVRIALDLSGTVFILASGPSLTQEQCDAVRGKGKVVTINTTFRLAPWANVLYACDGNWWDAYHEEASKTQSELWTQDVNAAKKYGLHLIPSQNLTGLGKGKVIHQGANSGYQAMNLAYLGGAKKMILLGFDMKATGGKKHHHGNHPSGLDRTLPFQRWVAAFEKMALDLKTEGVEVINATPGSALKWFRKENLETCLSQ